MRRQRRGGWKRGSKMEAGRERGSAGEERAGGPGAGPARGREAARACAGRGSRWLSGRPGGRLWARRAPRSPRSSPPLPRARKFCPRLLGHYSDGRGSLCGALGPAAKPALRPPARTLGTRPRPVGSGRGGLVRMPPAALRFCGVLAAASSHDNELVSAEGPGGRSAWRPAEAAAWWGGAGGLVTGGEGASKPGFPAICLPRPRRRPPCETCSGQSTAPLVCQFPGRRGQ